MIHTTCHPFLFVRFLSCPGEMEPASLKNPGYNPWILSNFSRQYPAIFLLDLPAPPSIPDMLAVHFILT